MAESLKSKAQDVVQPAPEALEGIFQAMRQVVPERLIPPGEGWVRFNAARRWEARKPSRIAVPWPSNAEKSSCKHVKIIEHH